MHDPRNRGRFASPTMLPGVARHGVGRTQFRPMHSPIAGQTCRLQSINFLDIIDGDMHDVRSSVCTLHVLNHQGRTHVAAYGKCGIRLRPLRRTIPLRARPRATGPTRPRARRSCSRRASRCAVRTAPDSDPHLAQAASRRQECLTWRQPSASHAVVDVQPCRAGRHMRLSCVFELSQQRRRSTAYRLANSA